ncbi:MAG: sensor histidine kinase [Methanobacteriota archaeon]|nr:MAG: sensor histidine kinase [Euryarchaeota archaeon]
MTVAFRKRLFSRIGVRFAAGLIAILLLMASLALYSTVMGRAALVEGVGLASEAIVDSLSKSMDMLLYLKSHEVLTFMGHEGIVKETNDSNAIFDAMEDPQAYINQIDENWSAAPLDIIPESMEEILENNISLLLKSELVEHYVTEHGMDLFTGVVLTNKYGAVISTTYRIADFRQADEAWWQSASQGELVITDITFEEDFARYAVSACLPVEGQSGEFLGAAKASFNILSVAKDIELTALGYETSELKIATSEGGLIFSSRAYIMLQDVSDRSYFEHVSGESGYFSDSEGGSARLFSYSVSKGYLEYDGHGWIMFLSHAEDEVLGPATDLQLQILLVASLAITLAIIVSLILSQSITRPIASLETATRKIARGEFEERINVTRQDEIGRLAETFNEMASELNLMYSDLEGKVKERTEALENLNKKLNVLSSITRHDALNQLTAQKGWLGIAIESSKDPALTDHLRKAESAADRLVSLLDFASEYEELGASRPEWVDLQKALESAITGLALAGKELRSRLDGVEVFADPMFSKVLHNLIGNSIKHGRGVTTISLSFSVGEGGMTIVVKDDGVGIPAERKGSLFRRESLADGEPSHGLFLSSEILGITNISIRETGVEGEGARFEIFVPNGRFRFVE